MFLPSHYPTICMFVMSGASHTSHNHTQFHWTVTLTKYDLRIQSNNWLSSEGPCSLRLDHIWAVSGDGFVLSISQSDSQHEGAWYREGGDGRAWPNESTHTHTHTHAVRASLKVCTLYSVISLLNISEFGLNNWIRLSVYARVQFSCQEAQQGEQEIRKRDPCCWLAGSAAQHSLWSPEAVKPAHLHADTQEHRNWHKQWPPPLYTSTDNTQTLSVRKHSVLTG